MKSQTVPVPVPVPVVGTGTAAQFLSYTVPVPVPVPRLSVPVPVPSRWRRLKKWLRWNRSFVSLPFGGQTMELAVRKIIKSVVTESARHYFNLVVLIKDNDIEQWLQRYGFIQQSDEDSKRITQWLKGEIRMEGIPSRPEFSTLALIYAELREGGYAFDRKEVKSVADEMYRNELYGFFTGLDVLLEVYRQEQPPFDYLCGETE